MAFKVSINLPNDTHVVVESDEAQLIRDIVAFVLRNSHQTADKNPLPGLFEEEKAPNGQIPSQRPSGLDVTDRLEVSRQPFSNGGDGANHEVENKTDREGKYVQFTQLLAPVGDMRRVVVAAEGARAFLELDAVSEDELVYLFDLAGWRRPNDFLQTLRNSARSTFRWLERTPGRPGYYSVTSVGKAAVIHRPTAMNNIAADV